MPWVTATRQNYLGIEQYFSDGTVLCYTPDGVPRPCDSASVAAQQSFGATYATELIPNVPTYMLEAPAAYEPAGAVDLGGFTRPPVMPLPEYSPPPPPPPPLPMEMMMASLPPTVLFNVTPANIETGAYGLRAPRPGQPVGSIPGYNELPFQVAGNSGVGLNSSYVNSLSPNQIASTLGSAGCALITNPAAKAACNAVLMALAMATNNSMGVSNAAGTNQQGGGAAASGMMLSPGGCPDGRVKVGNNCVDFTAMLPGGSPFTTPSMGIFGVPSAAPMMGTLAVLKCARGLVLGKDNRCYAKGSIPRNARKWAPEPRPLVSRSDVKALARIKSIKGRVKKAASSAGLSCATKGSRAGKPARKR